MSGQQTAFLLGWLDAMWTSFGDPDSTLQVPKDIQRKLVRMGFAAPESNYDESGARVVRITPLGIKKVYAINDRYNITRTSG